MAVEGSSLRALAAQGGIGLMNTRTGGGLTPENAYTTIGGGVRLVGGAAAKTALPVHGVYRGEKAGRYLPPLHRLGVSSRVNSGAGYREYQDQ